MTNRNPPQLVGVVLAAAFVAMLAGCTSGAPHATPAASAPTRSASPIATSGDTAPPTGGRPRVTDSPVPDPPPDYVLVQPLTFVGGFGVREPIDRGPEEYAEGPVIRDASGAIVAYRAVSGDLLDFIGERFGLTHDSYIVTINQVRRGGPTSPDGIGMLYAGDVVNLSAFTMTTYGNVNGVVRHDAPPDPMPPQR